MRSRKRKWKFWRATGQSNLADRMEDQTFCAFIAAILWYAKFDCPMTRQNFSALANAHDCKMGLEQKVGSEQIGLQ